MKNQTIIAHILCPQRDLLAGMRSPERAVLQGNAFKSCLGAFYRLKRTVFRALGRIQRLELPVERVVNRHVRAPA